MIARIRNTYTSFDPQFWVLFAGTLINAVGFSFIFPFITLYLTGQLGLTLTTVGALITLNSASGIVAQIVGGSLADRLGRKLMMAFSTLGSSLLIAGLGAVHTLPTVAGVVLLMGFINPLFQPASQAMIADLVGPDRRAEAYGLLRVANNLGVVIGPSVGGFVAARSYLALFLVAAVSGLVYFVILVLFIRETKPDLPAPAVDAPDAKHDEGYRQVLRDRPLLVFCIAMALIVAVNAQLWTVFPVYMKSQFGIPENRYGLLMAMNATMVVTLQFAITRFTSRFPHAEMMALGAVLYTIGIGSVGWSSSYWHFASNVMIATLGEMVLYPTAAAFVADLAPPHLRGRYMGAQGLAGGVGFGIGPLLGGALADRLGAAQAWPLMLLVGLVSAAGFLRLRKVQRTPSVVAF
ncbi:MAG: MDR family MFS transporter [Anaerolineae bacterium]